MRTDMGTMWREERGRVAEARGCVTWERRSSLARLLAFWRWHPNLGLRAWLMHYVLRPDGPDRALCAQRGLASMSAAALELRPGELVRLPPCDVTSASCSCVDAAVVAASPVWMRLMPRDAS